MLSKIDDLKRETKEFDDEEEALQKEIEEIE